MVEDPSNRFDPWNEWNQGWADKLNKDPSQAGINWVPITRIVHSDYDFKGLDLTNKPIWGPASATAQPGYPYLEATWTYASNSAYLNRFYRDHVKPLTPNSQDYDVTALSFEPLVVSGEWLSPALGHDNQDKSVYLARYPLWRLGVPYKSWTALQGDDTLVTRISQELNARGWTPRDPFLLIYRWAVDPTKTNGGAYGLVGVGAFDTRSRTLKVLNPDVNGAPWLFYDTYNYPVRAQDAVLGLNVDWVNGSLRWDFPPVQQNPTTLAMETAERPMKVPVQGSGFVVPADWPSAQSKVYDYQLSDVWASRKAQAHEDRTHAVPLA